MINSEGVPPLVIIFLGCYCSQNHRWLFDLKLRWDANSSGGLPLLLRVSLYGVVVNDNLKIFVGLTRSCETCFDSNFFINNNYLYLTLLILLQDLR